jgi:hypothetical protein
LHPYCPIRLKRFKSDCGFRIYKTPAIVKPNRQPNRRPQSAAGTDHLIAMGGPLSLQHHGAAVWLKNLKIRPL